MVCLARLGQDFHFLMFYLSSAGEKSAGRTELNVFELPFRMEALTWISVKSCASLGIILPCWCEVSN
jgi:hypothetical protein